GVVVGGNRVKLAIAPGITSVVGPKGSGKTTLMKLMTGLVRPSRGTIRVLGIAPTQRRQMFHMVGYATQFDSFPKGATGRQFISSFVRLFGYPAEKCERLTSKALDRIGMSEAADRKIAGYSKGMRQRIKLAQAIAHDPRILV